MDAASHGLWGGIAFGRKSRGSFWLAFSFGNAPDMLSFGIFFFERIFTHGFDFGPGPPALDSIPAYVPMLYNVTHSLVVFAAAFALVWLIRKKPLWPMAAWGFHVLMDIFTHGSEFFPTPFLWPISDYRFDGVPWSHPAIWYTNIGFLVLLYVLLWRSRKNSGGSRFRQINYPPKA